MLPLPAATHQRYAECDATKRQINEIPYNKGFQSNIQVGRGADTWTGKAGGGDDVT